MFDFFFVNSLLISDLGCLILVRWVFCMLCVSVLSVFCMYGVVLVVGCLVSYCFSFVMLYSLVSLLSLCSYVLLIIIISVMVFVCCVNRLLSCFGCSSWLWFVLFGVIGIMMGISLLLRNVFNVVMLNCVILFVFVWLDLVWVMSRLLLWLLMLIVCVLWLLIRCMSLWLMLVMVVCVVWIDCVLDVVGMFWIMIGWMLVSVSSVIFCVKVECVWVLLVVLLLMMMMVCLCSVCMNGSEWVKLVMCWVGVLGFGNMGVWEDEGDICCCGMLD